MDFWDIDEEGWAEEIDKFLHKPNPAYPVKNIYLLRRVDGATTIKNIAKISSLAKWVHPCKKTFLGNVFLPPCPLSLGSYLLDQPIYRSDSRFNLAILCFNREESEIDFHSLPLEQLDFESDSIVEDPTDYHDEEMILITRPQKLSQTNALAFDKLGIGLTTDRPTSCNLFRNSLVRPAFQESRADLIAKVNSLGQVNLENIGGRSSRATCNPFFTFPARDFFDPTEETLLLQTTIVFKDTASLALVEALATTEGGHRPHIHPVAFAPKEVRVQCENQEQLASLHRMLFTTKGTGIEAFYQKATNITWLGEYKSLQSGINNMKGQKGGGVNLFSPKEKAGIGYLEGVPLTTNQKGLDKIGKLFNTKLDASKLEWIQLREARPLLKVHTDNQLKFYQLHPARLPSMGVCIKPAPPFHPSEILSVPSSSSSAFLLSPTHKSVGKGLKAIEPIPPHLHPVLRTIKELTNQMSTTPKSKTNKERTLDEWRVVGPSKKKLNPTKKGKEGIANNPKDILYPTPKKSTGQKKRKVAEEGRKGVQAGKDQASKPQTPKEKGRMDKSRHNASPIRMNIDSDDEIKSVTPETNPPPPTPNTTAREEDRKGDSSSENESENESSDSSDNSDSDSSDLATSDSDQDTPSSPTRKRKKAQPNTTSSNHNTNTPAQPHTLSDTHQTKTIRRSKPVVPSDDEEDTFTPQDASPTTDTANSNEHKSPNPSRKSTQGTITAHFTKSNTSTNTPNPTPTLSEDEENSQSGNSDAEAKKRKNREKRQRQKKRKQEEEAERIRIIEEREKDLQQRIDKIHEAERRVNERRRETEVLNSPNALAKERERSRERRERATKVGKTKPKSKKKPSQKTTNPETQQRGTGTRKSTRLRKQTSNREHEPESAFHSPNSDGVEGSQPSSGYVETQ